MKMSSSSSSSSSNGVVAQQHLIYRQQHQVILASPPSLADLNLTSSPTPSYDTAVNHHHIVSPPVLTQQQQQQHPPTQPIPRMATKHYNGANNHQPCYEDHWVYVEIGLKRVPGISLGFSVAGGIDNPMYGRNTHVFITKLTSNGLAELDGRLRVNDILYKVNDVVLEDVEHADAVRALREAGKIVHLVNNRLLMS